ncbi:MAG: tetratricopeptide repeat protein [Myxococcales bacterium]|nr:tetratricopeptide repeat protein [Myxococcales bacterium]
MAPDGPLDPDRLRALLFDAVAEGDDQTLAELCATHEAQVLASFSGWTCVPEELRTPDALAWYGPGLIAVARHFAEVRQRPELLQSMMAAQEHPIFAWQRTLREVEAEMAHDQLESSAARLRALVAEVESFHGEGVALYLPVSCGRLGECLLQLGDARAALAPMQRALGLCESSDDVHGIAAYLGNLYEIHRYLGDAQAAARCLEEMSARQARQGRHDDAARSARQVAVVCGGEPLCRVVAEVGGQPFELSELPPMRGSVRFGFVRNRITLRRCAAAVKDGVAAAERGESEAALACFARAAAADAFDPWASYHTGLVCLELRRYDQALASYQRTEELAPGWYQCRSDLWLAGRLASGELTHETFVSIRRLLDSNLAPTAAIALAQERLRQDELGVLQLCLGNALLRLGRAEEAEQAYRRGLAVAEEPDVRTRLLVALGARKAGEEQGVRWLREAISLGGNLLASAMATVILASQPAN